MPWFSVSPHASNSWTWPAAVKWKILKDICLLFHYSCASVVDLYGSVSARSMWSCVGSHLSLRWLHFLPLFSSIGTFEWCRYFAHKELPRYISLSFTQMGDQREQRTEKSQVGFNYCLLSTYYVLGTPLHTQEANLFSKENGVCFGLGCSL